MMEAHQLALQKAKIQLMGRTDTAFFTTVLFSLKHIWDNSIGTAGTNGKHIRFNIDFFMNLCEEERLFLLLHETLHVALMHMLRLNGRDHGRWNVAADYVINLMLVKRGYKMPKGGLYDTKYEGMSVEEVYDALGEQKPEDTPWPDIEPPPLDSEELEEEVKDILVRAAIQSKMANDTVGSIPDEIQIFLDNLLKPKLPWQTILRRYKQRLTKHDYSYRKPNRRFFPEHYLPCMVSECLIDVTIAVDTSGSVSDHDFSVFIAETQSIFRAMKPRQITLIQFDTEIKEVSKLHSINDLRTVKFEGRGGTCIYPVLEWAKEHKPQLLLIFTDGHFHLPPGDMKLKTPLVWLIHNNPKFIAPHGKTIHYAI